MEIWHELGKEGTWNNAICTEKRGYVCESFKGNLSKVTQSWFGFNAAPTVVFLPSTSLPYYFYHLTPHLNF